MIEEAQVNRGRWVARCGWCGAGSPLGMRFGTPAFQCVECGIVTEVVWPSEEMARGIARLLFMRPHFKNRNWLPGETLNDLVWENAKHGVFDNLERRGIEANPGDNLLVIEPDRIRIDNLPAVTEATRRAVGA